MEMKSTEERFVVERNFDCWTQARMLDAGDILRCEAVNSTKCC